MFSSMMPDAKEKKINSLWQYWNETAAKVTGTIIIYTIMNSSSYQLFLFIVTGLQNDPSTAPVRPAICQKIMSSRQLTFIKLRNMSNMER